ncbi:unnamed protein product [Lactuca saligna]|uniref:LsmAD domain-containing protein n=1 Tax=Lactuca saligna TaxID=75948 RepID=A0AA35V9L2_LACSI|nr:unnamed protein product [Lactuca saligna]
MYNTKLTILQFLVDLNFRSRMNLQQVAPPRPSTNGFNRRRGEKEIGIRFDNKSQSGKSSFNKTTTTVLPTVNKGGVDNPSRERLVYLTTCLIGHQVDVQVTDGSIYSGIFHASNADNDFGIILKMACVTNTGSSQGQKNSSDSVNKAPSKTLIIPAKDLVQVVAKDVSVTRDGLTNEVHIEKQQDIMTDSLISRSRHVDLERELEPWVPDDDNIELPELDNTFDRHWNRGWDQFETNAALFGVKSTFNEELYTTKLDRGPQMRELEKQALRIAREIEGEDTQDLHLAEERGIHFHSSFDLDEETKYSSVFRGVDDSGYDENEDIWDSENNETFGNVSDSIINNQLTHLKSGGFQAPSLPLVEGQASQTSTSRDFYPSNSLHNESRIQDNQNHQSSQPKAGSYYTKEKEDTGKHMQFLEQNEGSKPEVGKKESSEKGLSADATAYAPSNSNNNNNKAHETVSFSEASVAAATVKTHEEATTTTTTTPQSLSSTSESGNAAPVSSPTSSMASEKSTLNPHAKEFRLNPNAKSFVPLQTPVRPPSPSPSPVAPAPEPSFYYPPPVSHMQPPVMYGPQTTSYQPQQPYFNPNVPQYGQQMLVGQPRQMVYMPTYPPEMQYKGRDF